MLALLFSFLLFQQPVTQEFAKDYHFSTGLMFEKLYSKEYPITLYKDSRDLIWSGTTYGVNVYNGYNVESYFDNLLDSTDFTGSFVPSISEDKFGRVWVAAYEGGVNIFNNGSSRLITPDNSNWDSRIIQTYSLLSDNDKMWVISSNKISRIQVAEDLRHFKVDDIEHKLLNQGRALYGAINSKGEVYLLSDYLIKVVYSSDRGIMVEKLLKVGVEEDIFITNTDQILIPSGDHLVIIESDEIVARIYPEKKESQTVRRAFKDSRGIYWLGLNDGVIRIELDENYNIIDQSWYDLSHIEDITEDSFGNIYFATIQRWIYKLNAGYDEFKYYSLGEENISAYLHKMHIDSKGRFWVGGNKGLFIYDVQSNQVLSKSTHPTIVSESIFDLHPDQLGNIWVAGYSGMIKYNEETLDTNFYSTYDLEMFPRDQNYELPHNIKFDSNEKLWFLAGERLSTIDVETNRIELFEVIGGEIKSIQKFIIDDQDILWAWNYDHTLERYDLTTGEPIWDGEIHLKDQVRRELDTILDVGDSTLWFGYSQGILIVDKESKQILKHLVDDEYVPKDKLNILFLDLNGYIWISKGPKGSIAINPNTLEIVYDLPDWLYNPLTSGYTSVHAIMDDGTLVTDGHGGFFSFTSNQLANLRIPRVYLKDFIINGNALDNVWYEDKAIEIDLTHSENDLTFLVVGIQQNEATRQQYQFKLEGAEDEWSTSSLTKSRSYLSLKPGEYTFFAKVSNRNGVWSDPVQLATISILPPWWANEYAYLAYVLFSILIVYLIYSSRLNKKIAESEAQRLKEVDEFKTRFFTNISHEFRTPLTVIMGLVDRIQHESTPIIKRNASKLLELINQILELSKVEANQVSLKLEQFDFIKYVNYSVESLSTLANERGIVLSVKTEFDELFVELDKEKVDLILHNLLSNALKFTEKEGQVLIRVTKESSNLVFLVADTGIGIKKEALDHIFNRFFQSDLENQRYEGTGIGLALTNELVQLMDGTIIVESEFGVGSTFTVTIPCSFIEAQEVVDQKADKLIKTAQRITSPDDAEVVLLVEDNYDVRSFIKQVLSEEYKVLVAHNGEEGVKLAMEEIPDIISTDVMMPYKDGFELTEELKEDVRTSHIPIIMLTAKTDVESRISGLKTGADVYLGKPFNEEELKTHIQNLITLRNSIQKRFGGEINIQELGESQEDVFVKKLHEIILQHLDDDTFGIVEVCNLMAVSRTQLHRKLKALTGKSTSIFIRDIRLVEAKKLLLNTQQSISEIAYSVGFNDPNYFTKLYSEKFSHSPSKEREMVS